MTFWRFWKKNKKLKVDIQRIRRCFAYPLNFYYRVKCLFSRKRLYFFFFLKKEGKEKVYKENSIILYFSIKKKKNKKIYILLFFSWLQCVVYDIFFFFLSDNKSVNGFIIENQLFAFLAFSAVLRQPKPMK